MFKRRNSSQIPKKIVKERRKKSKTVININLLQQQILIYRNDKVVNSTDTAIFNLTKLLLNNST